MLATRAMTEMLDEMREAPGVFVVVIVVLVDVVVAVVVGEAVRL